MKRCVICGNEFTSHYKQQICCNSTCSNIHYRRLSRDWNRIHRHDPPKPLKACTICGKLFHPRTANQHCCTIKCAKRYARHARDRPKPSGKSLTDWQREAQQCGMSYGKYRAAIEQLHKTFEELKNSYESNRIQE